MVPFKLTKDIQELETAGIYEWIIKQSILNPFPLGVLAGLAWFSMQFVNKDPEESIPASKLISGTFLAGSAALCYWLILKGLGFNNYLTAGVSFSMGMMGANGFLLIQNSAKKLINKQLNK